MPKPLTVPTWSTQANYTTNPDPAAIGQPTKLDPSSISVQGWTHSTRPNPRFFNFWQNHVGVWLSWVNTDVLSTDGGNYTLNAPLNFSNQGIGIGAGAELTIATDGFFYLNGVGTVTATGQLVFGSGAELTLNSGCNMDVASGVEIALAAGSVITGDPNFNGGIWNWAKPQINESTFSNSGTGHVRIRAPFALGASGAQTVGINNGDEFIAPLLTATLTITLSTTGAGTGSRMRFNAWANISTGFSVSIATAEATYLLRNDNGFHNCLDVVFYGGAWHTSCATPAL